MKGPPQKTEDMTIMLERRLSRNRERLIGMTDEERAWRAKFLKDQILDPCEPVIPSDYYKKRYNPIRRFYRAPLDKVENMLVPLVGSTWADGLRHITAKSIMGIIFIYSACYYFKYNGHDWTKSGGWRTSFSRIKQFPSDPGFPSTEVRCKGNEFAKYGFDKSPI
ncbi:NADH dehydrogenase ubiquinone 1 beta subcomplex subunit 6 [Vespula maculifrons]|uniref:NADH dehydrogenase ubiquinone 1 beta subcomplex subunit 6 n=1 Tax=Vespula maculifrons TaxID=7453 RepID=A0ABD2AGM9_VESMC